MKRNALRIGLSLGTSVISLGAQPPVEPRISIASSNNDFTLVVAGKSGEAYTLASSGDFATWTNWTAQSADSNGIARFPISFSSQRLFFRAFAASPETAASLRPEEAIGKRLFFETRFAQFFFENNGGDVNKPLAKGDPTLAETMTLTVPVPGPFAAQSMNCRACHLVDEQRQRGLGDRAYADFAIRSPIPERGDGRKTTVRNSPALSNASIPRSAGFFLHFDGEFPDGASLVRGTLTGRNFGWLPNEHAQAVAHIARVMREDDGKEFGGNDDGGAYRRVLLGTDPAIPSEFRLPEEFRLDVMKASDDEILGAVGRLVDAYLKSLTFARNADGDYEGSPYDAFLRKNSLPRRPDSGEDEKTYSRRLRSFLDNIAAPVFVTPSDGGFKTLSQSFNFGPKELEGLKMFLAEPDQTSSLAKGQTGNCVACHAAPHFTDFGFHNTGAAQWEYDSVHGEGAFAQITIPSLAERLLQPDDFLPATPAHPNAKGTFLAIPTKGRPGEIDLGLWNIYGNPDFAASQPPLEAFLSSNFGAVSSEAILSKTVAAFKTPGLRALGLSAPYLHTGQSSTIESVLFFYRFTSDLAREQSVRNVAPEIAGIFLRKEDAPAIAAFLRSLNQDIE